MCARLPDRHALLNPFEGGTCTIRSLNTDVLYRNSQREKSTNCPIVPSEEQTDGTMERISRRGGDGPHYLRSGCFSHRAGARVPASEHSGSEAQRGSTSPIPGGIHRPGDEGRQERSRAARQRACTAPTNLTRDEDSKKHDSCRLFLRPPTQTQAGFTLNYEPMA